MKKMNGNMNEVLTDFRYVYHKKNEYSETICNFLIHLTKKGFKYSPRYIGENEENYILEYVEGSEVNLNEIDGIETHISLLNNIAKIINQFHSIGTSFEWTKYDYFLSYNGTSTVETICHNDLAPYNTIVNKSINLTLIDYDTICPGPRIWDIVYLAYRFIGLGLDRLSYQKEFKEDELKEIRIKQVKLLCKQTKIPYNSAFFEVLIKRLESLCMLFDTEIEKGNRVFINMKTTGHYDFYKKEIKYIQQTYFSG